MHIHTHNGYSLEEYISDVDFSQIIQIRPYQFEPLSDNNETIERYESVWEVRGTLTRSDIEETPYRLLHTDCQFFFMFAFLFILF